MAYDPPGEDPTLADARATYLRAQQALLAAEAAYARAYRALEAAQAPFRAGAPVPRPQLHYACGHAGMVATARGATQWLSLCPACAARLARDAFPFAPLRTLLLPAESPPERRPH